MTFSYTAFDRAGKPLNGTIEAASSAEASESLRARGLFTTKITESTGGATAGATRGKPGNSVLSRLKIGGRGRKLKHLVTFTRQLHVLITSGTPLVQALGALERQSRDPDWLRVISDVRRKVEEGAALSAAMADHPDYFDDVSRSLVSAGEAGGKLDALLERLGKLIRSQLHIRSSVVGALVYPILLIFISVVVMSILLVFVLPRFATMFTTLGSPLPPTTKIVMSISDILTGYWWAIIAGGIGLFFGLRLWTGTPSGKRRTHGFLALAPGIGKITRSFATAQMARLLGIQIESKVPLLEALALTRQAARNLLFKDLIQAAEDAATRGQPISSAFAQSNLMSPAVVEAIKSGEQSGQVASLLMSIADFLDEENDVVVRSLTSIIEPVILVGLGIMVGFVALSMFLPLFDLTSTTAGGG